MSATIISEADFELPRLERSLAYLIQDSRRIAHVCIVREQKGFQFRCTVTFKDTERLRAGVISEELFLMNLRDVREKILDVLSESKEGSVNVKMRYHTLGGSGQYALTFQATDIEFFKHPYLQSDMEIVKNL